MQHAQSKVKPAVNDARVDEDALRVHLYRLIAHYLSAPPTQADLELAAGLSASSETLLGERIGALAAAARSTFAEQEADAYQTLFVGLGRGVFVPFGSYYLTGFLNEKPLARLRSDMAMLGVARNDDVSEPEDHIASVLEIMAGLIAGDFGSGSLEAQRGFFETHVRSWAGHFFRDLSVDGTSAFYAALGALGLRFIEVEEHAFQLA
ncbi:MAG TPA: molecular chaperone TorD family protein [Hyphomicrobiaceae bacterium]|nr:molecular chaperone TorD family protein [Hyphomicrobiaceae bacterium]